MKKSLITSLVLLLCVFAAHAEVIKPISWSYSLSPDSYNSGDTLTLIFEADIEKDWYLYSNDFDPAVGPMVTSFTFTQNDTYLQVDSVMPIGAKRKYDSLWEGEYTYFTKHARFEQKVVAQGSSVDIQGGIAYQVCTDVTGRCIPFNEDFSFGQSDETSDSAHAFQATDTSQNQEEKGSLGNVAQQKANNSPYTLLSFMLVAFLAGLAALLTPCVFPMIPMTVTFFTGKSNGRFYAVIYGLSIIVIYTLIGTVMAKINGPAFANFLSTHWIPNVLFFLIFTIFAISFFGYFDITLPNKWVNKVDQQSDKGGLVGVFFMAFTLVLVSFSCTGPIVGSILVESAGGQFIKPIAGMFAFSLAFALPFTLFAMFPGWLNTLPKSGGWLNSVKVVLGFLELALGLKFLSIADQVYHWNILNRDIYIALWIVIFAMLGAYLLGKLRFPHDSETKHINLPGLLLAIASLTFVVYLVPGLFGAPLKAISGYLPPMTTQDFNLSTANIKTPDETSEGLCGPPKYASMLELPHGLKGYFDYDQAIACAKELNKPIFVDFTGHGCVNCREMEARVWSEPEVLQRLREDFIILALYVDEKKKLPEEDWYTSAYDDKVKKTIGSQNADLQITRFNNNAQPFYVILDENGKLLIEPIAYELNTEKFASFLDQGKAAFYDN